MFGKILQEKELKNRQINKWIVRQKDSQKDRQKESHKSQVYVLGKILEEKKWNNRQINRWIVRQKDRQKDSQMGRQIDRQIEGQP